MMTSIDESQGDELDKITIQLCSRARLAARSDEPFKNQAIARDKAKAALRTLIDREKAELLTKLDKWLDEPVDISLFGHLPANPQKTQELHKLARVNVKAMIAEELASLTQKAGGPNHD